MIFALGCRRPDPAKFAAHPHASAHPLVAMRLEAHDNGSAPLPPSADKLPARPRADQGMSGSCTWGAGAIALFTACNSLGTPLGFLPSMQAGYSATLAFERKDPTAPLTDAGADPENVFTVWTRYGVRPMKCDRTPDGRFYDIWTPDDVANIPNAPPPNVTDEPEETDLDVADATKVELDVAPHRIDPADPRASDLIAAALAAEPAIPVYIAGFVDTAFMRLGPSDVAAAPNTNDPQGGGHAIWLSKYRTNAAGEREFFLENSWGDGWAASGGVWVSMAFIRSLWGLWVLDVRVKKGSV